MERINILWTGGFDSTFRISQLSLLPVQIQPYYIREGRKSEKNELKAMSNIAKHINLNSNNKCILLPLTIINQKDVNINKQISNSFKVLQNETGIGTQYDLLARFAYQNDLVLEVGFEYNPNSKIRPLFLKYGKLNKVSVAISDSRNIEFYELDLKNSSNDLLNIFGNFRFGLPLFNLTKRDTVKAYKEIGYEKIISMTWFCAHPLFGKPCGLCNPCENIMRSDMNFRMPWMSVMLYKALKSSALGRATDRRLKAFYNRHFRK